MHRVAGFVPRGWGEFPGKTGGLEYAVFAKTDGLRRSYQGDHYHPFGGSRSRRATACLKAAGGLRRASVTTPIGVRLEPDQPLREDVRTALSPSGRAGYRLPSSPSPVALEQVGAPIAEELNSRELFASGRPQDVQFDGLPRRGAISVTISKALPFASPVPPPGWPEVSPLRYEHARPGEIRCFPPARCSTD